MSPSSSLLLLAKTMTHPAARSLCDSWASCLLRTVHMNLAVLHSIILMHFIFCLSKINDDDDDVDDDDDTKCSVLIVQAAHRGRIRSIRSWVDSYKDLTLKLSLAPIIRLYHSCTSASFPVDFFIMCSTILYGIIFSLKWILASFHSRCKISRIYTYSFVFLLSGKGNIKTAIFPRKVFTENNFYKWISGGVKCGFQTLRTLTFRTQTFRTLGISNPWP